MFLKQMTRRDFLKLLGVSSLGAVVASCAPPPTPVPPTATPVPPTATRVAPTATTAPTTAPTAAPTTPPTAAPTTASAAAPGVTVAWFGQSMFTMKVGDGPLIMMDPVGASVGYKVTPINNVDVVTITHEHADHNNIALAPGSPKILRGLAGSDWAKVDETVKGVRIRTVNVFHDDTQGSVRGKNAVFIFEASGLKVVHLGDLGHLLSPEQVTAIGRVDVLMIPVGGNYTIDAAKATQVMDSLKPRVVIPMHYKTAVSTPAVVSADAFLTGKTVERVSSNKMTFSAATLPKSTTVFVLGYE